MEVKNRAEIQTGPAMCPDEDMQWYDFGRGIQVAPTTRLPDTKEPYMVSLVCVREGKFYYRLLEGQEEDFTEHKLAELMAEQAPLLIADMLEKYGVQY